MEEKPHILAVEDIKARLEAARAEIKRVQDLCHHPRLIEKYYYKADILYECRVCDKVWREKRDTSE